MYGLDNRDLTAKDRLTLLTQTQIMKQNGHSEGEIKAFSKTFYPVPDVAGIGGDFCAMLGKMGYSMVLVLFFLRAIV